MPFDNFALARQPESGSLPVNVLRAGGPKVTNKKLTMPSDGFRVARHSGAIPRRIGTAADVAGHFGEVS